MTTWNTILTPYAATYGIAMGASVYGSTYALAVGSSAYTGLYIEIVNGQPVFNYPVNTEAPVITGTAVVGNVLTCSQGVWSGDTPIAYTYLFLRDGIPIGAPVSNEYTLVDADVGSVITCLVTGTNVGGSGFVYTAPTGTVAEVPPINTVAPVASGYVYAGKSLSVTTGTWTSYTTPTYTYQWQRNTTNITSATSSTYAIVTADEGQSIRCVVTATNTASGVAANSNALTDWVPSALSASTWIDFADIGTITKDGSNRISSMANKGTSGIAFTQGTDANKPVYTASAVNSLSAALFDGTNDKLTATLAGNQTTFTVLIIAKLARLRQYDAFFDSASVNNDLTCEQDSATGKIDFWQYGVGRKAISVATSDTTKAYVYQWSYNGTTATTFIQNAGGGSEAVASGVLKAAVALGGDVGSGGFYYTSGYICEAVVMPTVATSGERASFQTYANQKWAA